MVIFFLPQELSCRGGVVNGWWDGGVDREDEEKGGKKERVEGIGWRGGRREGQASKQRNPVRT